MQKIKSQFQTVSFIVFLFLSLNTFAEVSVVPDQSQKLKHLIKHDCGSCHGMTLKGGLGPSLEVSVIKKKPDELLFITIKEGRAGTPMPAWKSLLSDKEIHLIIQLLRKGLN